MESFLKEIDARRAYGHTEWLTKNAPYRQGGSEREHRAAGYFADRLADFGYEVQMVEFMGYMGFPGTGRLEVVAPEIMNLPLSVFAHCAGTPAGGVETELVYCGQGAEADYSGRDVRGKVVLTELSFTPPRPEKARLAMENGAAGILMIHFLSGEYDNLPEGCVKSIWGNPTDQTMPLMQRAIPSGGLRRADGQRLKEMLERGQVRVRLTVEAERSWTRLLMPVGFLPGAEPEFTLLGGHMDSWSGGATDNAAADGSILELARVAALRRSQLRRGLMVAFWPAHEQGIMEGSTWFVDSFWDRLDQNCTLYLNLDEMGKRETTEIRSWASPEADSFVADSARAALGVKGLRARPLVKAGDQSFFGIGVPSVWVNSGPDAATLKNWQGADYAWWWHTRSDTLDKVDTAVLERELQVNGYMLWQMSTAHVLPFRFQGLADRIAGRLGELGGTGEEHLDLSAPVAWAARLQQAAHALDAASERGVDTSRIQMEVSRALTSITASVAGRWHQDSYGLSDLTTFLPGLRASADLPGLAGSDRYYLILNRLVKERNRVRDGIARACQVIESAGVI